MFRSILGGCLLFCALLAWSGTLFYLQGDSLTAWFDSAGSRSSGIMSMSYDEQPELDYEPTRVDITTLTPRMPLRIVSFNVRYATSSPVRGEKPWSERGSRLVNELNFLTAGHENAFLCFQEVLYDQLQDIRHGLGPSWASIGRGRDDGDKKGEFSPVFYRSDVWRLERSQTRWLSETPEKPSYGWGASHRRVVVMGEFSHKVTGTKVVVMSTHFDYEHKKARQHSAEHLLQYAHDWSSGNDTSAVLIGGDFNSTPDDVAYKLMTAPGSGIYDISDLLPEEKHHGNRLTYTSFGEPNEWPQRIDFLFIQEPVTALVKTFSVVENVFDDRVRVSDHRPVVSDLEIVVDPSA